MPIKRKQASVRKPRSDAQRNRERILEVAKEAFTRSGANTSLDDIAREAGVGPGTLYRHFPTREELLEAVYRTEMEKLARAEQKFAEELPPIEALRAWLLLFVEYIAAKQLIAPALNALLGDPKKVFEASYARIHEVLRSLVKRAIKSDETILGIQNRISAGDLDGAFRALDAAIRSDPKNGGLINLRGIIHAQRGETTDAAADFELSIRYSPALARAYLNLGRILQMRPENGAQDASRAIALYRKVLSIQPDSAESHLQLAHLLDRSGKSAEALAQIDPLPAGVLAQPGTKALRCSALAGAGKVDDARRAAAEFLAASDVPASSLEEAAYGLLRNKELRKEGRQMLERVALSDPKATAPLIALARAAYEDRDLDGTLGYLAHARDLDPGSAPIHYFIGIVALELDLAVEARNSLERAIALDAGNAFYQYALGGVILQTGQPGEAIPYFRKYIESRLNDPRGHFALGAAEYAAGDLEQSRKEMEIAVRSKETGAGAEYFLGRIAMQEDNRSEAREHLLRSIHANPLWRSREHISGVCTFARANWRWRPVS